MAGFPKAKQFRPKYPSKYMGDPTKIVSRSGWESKLMRKLDESSTILGWASEEIVVPYISPVDGRAHRYFVDFLVVAKSPKGEKVITLIEVKPFAQTQLPKQTAKKTKERFMTELSTYAVNQAKWEAAEAYCTKRGWKFTVLTEQDINFV